VLKIIKVAGPQEGVEVCKKLLYELVSKNTVLFLSGGSTPKNLYEILAKEKKLKAGAVAMVDERYVSKSKISFDPELRTEGKNQKSKVKEQNSELGTNELMIKNTQLLSYLDKSNIKFYPVLENKEIVKTALDYDETVRFLFSHFQKSVAILGVGTDGHTAGIPVGIQNSETDLVTSFDNFPGEFKKRISLTFLGLSKFDQIIVMVFGEDKKKALKLILRSGSLSEIPARFLTQEEIAGKVTLITDQSV